MHQAARAFIESVWGDPRRIDQESVRGVVEIGAYNVNGQVKDLFESTPDLFRWYWGIDLEAGPGVDEVADGATWQPARGERIDLVVCCEVLEHTRSAGAIIANAYKMLRKGGYLLVTCAGDGRGEHGHHGGALLAGEYYANVPSWYLEGCLLPFESASVIVNHADHDLYAFARK